MPKNWRTRLGAILGPNPSDHDEFDPGRREQRMTMAEIPTAIESGLFHEIEPVLVVDDGGVFKRGEIACQPATPPVP